MAKPPSQADALLREADEYTGLLALLAMALLLPLRPFMARAAYWRAVRWLAGALEWLLMLGFLLLLLALGLYWATGLDARRWLGLG